VLLAMLGTDFSGHIELPANGASGVLVAWRRALRTTGQHRIDSFSVSVQFCPDGGQAWWATWVYGPQGNEEKIQFMQELREIRTQCHGPWMIAGDFNLIFKAEDKNNSNYNRAMMGRFRRLIDDLALKEIPLHGRKFTWSNQQESPTLVKLDRVLCTVEWEDLFPNTLLQSAASFDSDHCPLLLGLKDNKPGKRHFHFEAFWLKLEGFHEAVEEAWHSVQPGPCPLLTLQPKFRAAAKGLQAWSDKMVGHESQLGLAREILHQLEIAQDGRTLSQDEKVLKGMLKKKSLLLASLKRTIAKLRSRINWLKEGDANTSFFQLHARHRKRKNFIGKIVSDTQVCTSHDDKTKLIDEFYDNLLGKAEIREHTIDLHALGVTVHNLAELDSPIAEKEVWETIKQLLSDKAPGPDRFTGGFYKACWTIIKQDVMATMSAVWSRKFLNFDKLNNAYITLIPKMAGAEQVKDFRPISLVHSFAKLITKLLANRLG
jgi:hypothetical protein